MSDREMALSFFSEVCAPSEFEGMGVCSGCGKANGSCNGNSLLFFGYSGAFRCLVRGFGDTAFVRSDTALLYSMEGPQNQSWSTKSVRDFMYLCPQGGCREIDGYPGSCSFGTVPANVIMVSNTIPNEKKRFVLQTLLNDTWFDDLYAAKNGDSNLLSTSFANNLLQTPPASPPPPLPPTPSASSGNSATGAIAGGVATGAAPLFAAPAIALAYWQRRKPEDHFFDVPAEEDPEVHLGQLKRFSLRELQVATDNFSNRNFLGRGGFGKVYKGRLADGSLVAVKRLKEERTQVGELQFQTEVEMISMAVHRNLLRLRGFCMTPTERLLVYPYMANGSVASCLRDLKF